MENWTYIVGIIIGVIVLLSVVYVWITKQVVGMCGGFLSIIGVVLIGLSLWTSVEISITKEGFKTQLTKMMKDLGTMAEQNANLTSEINKIVENVETSNNQYIALTTTLNNRRVIDNNQLNQLQSPIQHSVPIDKNKLKDAENTFKSLIKPR